MLVTGDRAFLELLRQEGVDMIFGNPGTTELPLMDALAVETTPRYVLGLQESAVMAMAGGYAQASGRLTAVNIHVAPGLGNAMGMLYDAQKAGAPRRAGRARRAGGGHRRTRASGGHGQRRSLPEQPSAVSRADHPPRAADPDDARAARSAALGRGRPAHDVAALGDRGDAAGLAD